MLSVTELAEKLISTVTEIERKQLLRENAAAADLALAQALKQVCETAWTSEPQKVIAVSDALQSLALYKQLPEITALSWWVAGVKAIVQSQLIEAVESFERAVQIFDEQQDAYQAAQTQVAKIYALAMLGRYQEAIECGQSVLIIFKQHGDIFAAAKTEHNLGNICYRRDYYEAAEKFYNSARIDYAVLNDQTHLAMLENSLAVVKALQNDFRAAEQLYEQSLRRAKTEGLLVTQAETEASLGNLALFRGRFNEALAHLEESRNNYAALGMPHQTAIADLEIADVYLELNLLQEAQALYQRIGPQFESFKLRAEEARARMNLGKTLARLGEQPERALSELERAETLYRLEENSVGVAQVKLILADLALRGKNYQSAKTLSREAEKLFQTGRSPRNGLLAKLICGESERRLQNPAAAKTICADVLANAEPQQPQIAWAAATMLGLLAKDDGDLRAAESYFKNAVEIIESLRSPLAGDEFRTAFFTDKITPYQNLADLCRMDPGRAAESFAWIENSRSQALLDLLTNSMRREKLTDDNVLQNKFEQLREELNWFYSRLSRPPSEISATASQTINLRQEIARLEREINLLVLQTQTNRQHDGRHANSLDLPRLQNALGERRVLLEFAEFGGEYAAFVVGENTFELVEHLGSPTEIQHILEDLHFQFGTLRYGAAHLQKHLPVLKTRTDRLLQKLYEILLRPLAALTAEKHLVIVPAKNLHYVPFQALRDGHRYLIEKCEVSFAPSAAVLQNLLKNEPGKREKILAVGFADKRVPQVEREVASLSNILASARILTGADATFAAIKENLARESFDVLHLACHGQFRATNPLFSSLHLGDGWATVRDAAQLQLKNALVVLSACETGLSQVAAGEELLGLTRGFLAAGANALVITLWTVNDEATADLMRDFYKNLRKGLPLAASLRAAQKRFIEQDAHPYFWSPFVLTGKW